MSQRIRLPYGKDWQEFSLPDGAHLDLLAPNPVSACADADAEIERALEHPLESARIEEIVRSSDRVTILVDDYTRGTPVPAILPHLLRRLAACGIPDERITMLVSTGTHRPCTTAELVDKFGQDVYSRFKVVQHDCTDAASQVFLGLTGRGTPVWVHRAAVETDRLFGIGHVDPSDYAGYAGGGKLIVPGVAALETVDANHSLAALSFRQYGRVDLPCRQDIDEAGALVHTDLFVNVVLCQDGQIARAFAGSPPAVHTAGVRLAKQVYEVNCPGPVDVTIASAYPYDIDFYQAIRAIEYADVITRPGGSILVAAPCQDGMGSEAFFRLLAEPGRSPDDFLRSIVRRSGKVTYNVLGYFLARIRAEKRIYACMPGIPDAELAAIGVHPLDSLQAGVDSLLTHHGSTARVAVLPVGSATIPRLASMGLQSG